MKQRIEYNHNDLGKRLAVAQQAKMGGRVAISDSRTLWYSYHHTMTEILADHKGETVQVA